MTDSQLESRVYDLLSEYDSAIVKLKHFEVVKGYDEASKATYIEAAKEYQRIRKNIADIILGEDL